MVPIVVSDRDTQHYGHSTWEIGPYLPFAKQYASFSLLSFIYFFQKRVNGQQSMTIQNSNIYGDRDREYGFIVKVKIDLFIM